jgi:hypothetical protein
MSKKEKKEKTGCLTILVALSAGGLLLMYIGSLGADSKAIHTPAMPKTQAPVTPSPPPAPQVETVAASKAPEPSPLPNAPTAPVEKAKPQPEPPTELIGPKPSIYPTPTFPEIATDRRLWPNLIELTEPLAQDIELDGEVIGEQILEVGTKILVKKLNPETNQIIGDIRGSEITLQASKTNIVQLVHQLIKDRVDAELANSQRKKKKEKKSHELNQLIEKTLADAAAMKKADGYVQPQAVVSRARSSSEKAGFDDGWIFGKADAWAGKKRDGLKAARFGKIHAQDYPGDKKAYAEGYHSGYNEGWHAARSVGAGK